jgi:hypothetical protein
MHIRHVDRPNVAYMIRSRIILLLLRSIKTLPGGPVQSLGGTQMEGSR